MEIYIHISACRWHPRPGRHGAAPDTARVNCGAVTSTSSRSQGLRTIEVMQTAENCLGENTVNIFILKSELPLRCEDGS